MTFLNPFALFALIAASFPVLFHLFAQRKSRRIEFSSLRFLRLLEKSSMRKIKLRQILLLILRTLLIASLVFAFSRPALRGSLGGFFGSSHANTTAIILFDNSASMARRDGSGSLFKQAQDAALTVATALEDGDELLLIPIASLERGKQYQRLHDPQEIRKAITDLSLSDAEAHLGDALRIASAEISRSANVNREIYLVSDNQARNITGITSDSSLKLFDAKANFFSLTTAGASTTMRNLSIDSLVLVTTVFEGGRPIEFTASIRNTGDVAIENAIVSLFYNDERVAQRAITSLASQKTENITISALPKNTGIVNVRAELEEDALPFDNKRYLSLELPATSRVAIFTNSTADADFLRLALEQTLGENTSLPYSIELHRIEELRMLPSLRSRLDAVFVEIGNQSVDASDAKALREYIASGRGAALFPLSGITPTQFNSQICSVLGLPALESLDGSLQKASTYYSLATFDLAHPFFNGMFDKNSNPNSRGIESPKIYQYYKFAGGGLPLIKLSTGAPFLSDIRIGKGDVLLFSVAPNFSTSDLPRKPIFLPLMRRSAAYLSSISSHERSDEIFFTGQPVDHTLPPNLGIQAGERLLVKGPNNIAQRVEVKGSATGALHLMLETTPFAGIYSIYKDADSRDALTAFAVNSKSDESNVQVATTAQLQKTVEQFGVQSSAIHLLDPSRKDLTEVIRQSRFGVELWQIFLVIAVICAIAEMLIAREGKVKE